MNINEITGYHDNVAYQTAKTVFAPADSDEDAVYKRKQSLDTFMDFLDEHGFKKLGRGSFGLVFEKSDYPWVFKIFTTDSAYLSYVKWAIANQSNPNVPKFKGKLIKVNNDTYAIRMEKLTEFKYSSYQIGHPMRRLHDLITAYAGVYNVGKDDLKWLKNTYPGICAIVSQYKKNPDFKFDMHAGNIMMRGNIPVIVDPIYDPTKI
jgi:hypothetical protein